MTPGDVTQGVRVCWDSTAPWELKPGEYMYRPDADQGVQVWARLPNGQGPANLSTWSPVIEEDGTLTLSPSILSHPDSAAVDDQGTMKQVGTGWHGFLERGVWREV